MFIFIIQYSFLFFSLNDNPFKLTILAIINAEEIYHFQEVHGVYFSFTSSFTAFERKI